MKKVIGKIYYEVYVNCPHCKGRLNLNEYPYDQDDENELGKNVFGSVDTPGKWDINIEYKCCRCKRKFILSKIEY